MKERLNREIYDLGPGYYAARINPERASAATSASSKALGYTVTLQPSA